MNYLSICKRYPLPKEDTNMSIIWLMKMVYITHGFFLGFKNENPYIGSDQFQAWEHGPVLPALYRDYRHCRETDQQSFNDLVDGAEQIKDDYDQRLIDWVKARYKDSDGWDLVKLTHGAGTPWDQSYERYHRSIVIKDKIILNYYSRLVNDIVNSQS
jgi:uncharacterized phage-associated protein